MSFFIPFKIFSFSWAELAHSFFFSPRSYRRLLVLDDEFVLLLLSQFFLLPRSVGGDAMRRDGEVNAACVHSLDLGGQNDEQTGSRG